MSALNGDGTITTCFATHLDGQYTCENTQGLPEVEVIVFIPEVGKPTVREVPMRLRQLPCGCLLYCNVAFSEAYGPINQQIVNVILAKRSYEQAMIAALLVRIANNRQNGRH